jgi:pilus assembly protein Flp/PilA
MIARRLGRAKARGGTMAEIALFVCRVGLLGAVALHQSTWQAERFSKPGFPSMFRHKEQNVKPSVLRVLRNLHRDESGQDLIEYALVAALIAFGAVTTMQTLASDINIAFSGIGSKLDVYAS